jgi:hypothetical protein
MFRIDPKMPAGAYKTYGLTFPVQTHFRPATCEEVGCQAFKHGWRSAFDVSTDLGKEQADYVRRHSGRSFKEVSQGVFEFAPGQTCFAASTHRLKLEREPIYVVRGGDWRGNPDGFRIEHKNAQNWQEDFAEHQDIIATRIERG